jgi:uncharacterized protein YjbI with pentapeptide repeats
MYKDEAIKLLKGGEEGFAEWNRRRKTGQSIPHLLWVDLRLAQLPRANLTGADFDHANLFQANLAAANLIGADLMDADLHGANLAGATLTSAKLDRANLIEADLSGANLTGADLSGANLAGANLTEAKLCDANLFRVSLLGADLRGADLKGARCLRTSFDDVDLSEVKGLDSVQHHAPSTIGVDTLFRSNGKISEAFLKGCGVPEALIEYVASPLGSTRATQFYSCYISYSHLNEEFGKRLYWRMMQEKMRVWYAPENMPWGRKLNEEIERGIRTYDKVLLVLSPTSMSSEWVKFEIRKARMVEASEKKRKLFPIRLVAVDEIQRWVCLDADSGKDVTPEIREYNIGDFSNWKNYDAFEAAFAKLLKNLELEGLTGASASPSISPATPQ